jgi:hypothetical protein
MEPEPKAQDYLQLHNFLQKASYLRRSRDGSLEMKRGQRRFFQHILSNLHLANAESFRNAFLKSIPHDIAFCDSHQFTLCILRIDLARRFFLIHCPKNRETPFVKHQEDIKAIAATIIEKTYFENLEKNTTLSPESKLKVYLAVHEDDKFRLPKSDIKVALQSTRLSALTQEENRRVNHVKRCYSKEATVAEILVCEPRWVQVLQRNFTTQCDMISAIYKRTETSHGKELARQILHRQYKSLTEAVLHKIRFCSHKDQNMR